MKKLILSTLSLALFSAGVLASVNKTEPLSVSIYPEKAKVGSILTILDKNFHLPNNVVAISHHWMNENKKIVAIGRKLSIDIDNINNNESVNGCTTITFYSGKSKTFCSQPVMFEGAVPQSSKQPIIENIKMSKLPVISEETEVSFIAYDPDIGTDDRDGLADNDQFVWLLESENIGDESTVLVPTSAEVRQQITAFIQVTSDDTSGGAGSAADSVVASVMNNFPGGNCEDDDVCSLIRPLYVDETGLIVETDIQTFTTNDLGEELSSGDNHFSVIPATDALSACEALGDYQLVSDPERFAAILNEPSTYPNVANWPDGRQFWTSQPIEGDVFGSTAAVALDDNTGLFGVFPVNPSAGGLVVCEPISDDNAVVTPEL